MVHDLPEELYLASAARNDVMDLGEDIRLRPHPLVAARVRHHAEAAEFVAALDDRDVRPGGIAAANDAQRKRDIVVRI